MKIRVQAPWVKGSVQKSKVVAILLGILRLDVSSPQAKLERSTNRPWLHPSL